MSEKDKDIVSLGDDFEVIEDEPKPAAASGDAQDPKQEAGKPTGKSAPPPQGGTRGPMPLRKAVSQGSLGLLLGIGGLLAPYGASQIGWLAALAAAAAVWQLLAQGLGRLQPTAKPLSPGVPLLVLVAGVIGLAGSFTGMLNPEDAEPGGVLGGLLAVLGGALALAAPGMAKKADAKLPPAPPEPEVDRSFSLSLLAYGVIVAMLLMPWGGEGGALGVDSYVGALTMLFCVIGVWASWAGMWRNWAMPAVSSGVMGLALFLAPIEAALYGVLGTLRLASPEFGEKVAWPVAENVDFLQHGMPAAITAVAGGFACYELFHGAKKAMEANKKRKEEEFAKRKAARAARREKSGASGGGKQGGAGTGKKG